MLHRKTKETLEKLLARMKLNVSNGDSESDWDDGDNTDGPSCTSDCTTLIERLYNTNGSAALLEYSKAEIIYDVYVDLDRGKQAIW